MDARLLQAAELIQKSSCVYALTGAGASVESGIPDFRSASGLWARFDPMEYGSIGTFRRDPITVWDMLCELMAIVDALPNAGHRAMAVMEEREWLQEGRRIIEVNPEPVLWDNADMVVDMPFAAAMQGMLAALEQLGVNRTDS